MNMVISTAHSTAFHIKDLPYLPHSAAIKFHNITPNIPYRSSTAHSLAGLGCLVCRNCEQCWICMVLGSIWNNIAATHNIIHSPCTSTHNTHPVLPFPLPSTTLVSKQLTNTKHSWQDVGMVWMCCGIVPILFGWFLSVPSPHALVSFGKRFCDYI